MKNSVNFILYVRANSAGAVIAACDYINALDACELQKPMKLIVKKIKSDVRGMFVYRVIADRCYTLFLFGKIVEKNRV